MSIDLAVAKRAAGKNGTHYKYVLYIDVDIYYPHLQGLRMISVALNMAMIMNHSHGFQPINN